MATPEKVKKMNALARKWDEVWEDLKELEPPEQTYILTRIRADMTTTHKVDREAPERTAQN